MSSCTKCDQLLREGEAFCGQCGAPVRRCPKCGEIVKARLQSPPQMLAAGALHAQPEFAIHALHLLVVHSDLLMQVQMQTPIAKARMLTRQFAQPFLNQAVISSALIPASSCPANLLQG